MSICHQRLELVGHVIGTPPGGQLSDVARVVADCRCWHRGRSRQPIDELLGLVHAHDVAQHRHREARQGGQAVIGERQGAGEEVTVRAAVEIVGREYFPNPRHYRRGPAAETTVEQCRLGGDVVHVGWVGRCLGRLLIGNLVPHIVRLVHGFVSVGCQ